MSDRPSCPDCGAELPADSPRGPCPRCLLPDALAGGPDRDGEAAPTGDQVAAGGVLETIALTVGPLPRVLLRDADGGPEPPPLRPGVGADARHDTRYRIDGEIARGGMGTVFKGRDPDLGRDIAIKVLRDDFRDNPEMVRRFVEEAQIGGQLQHPGIVPIYELGTFGDRRPFFAMKLVKGDTLARLLAGRKGPADELRRFLAIFEAACQAVAYAHARGVIHRDLKPANVMVGSFGEVQVMDWGLAKVLPRGGGRDDAPPVTPGPPETVIATARSGGGDDDLSRAGSVLGTPSNMAPEQARGEVDGVDERADVFGLGSILCEVLTGRPAVVGGARDEVQRRTARGEVAGAMARLDACGADAELVALAKDCLAAEAGDRPRDAGVVAARVTAYLAAVQERLRRAELARVEERGRRRLTTVAAAAVLLLGSVAGGGYAWAQRQRAERGARTARAVDDALTDVARLRGEAQADPAGAVAKWAEARAAAKRAEALLAQGEADPAPRGRVAALLAGLDRERAEAVERARRLGVDRALLADLDAVRGDRSEHWDPKRTDAGYGAAFRKAGLGLDATGPAEAGRWLAARSEPVELASYLDDWAATRRAAGRAGADWRRLVATARGADPDPWRAALRQGFASQDAGGVAELRRLADDAALEDQPAASLVLLANQLKLSDGDGARAARVLRRAESRHPGDFWIQFHLAGAMSAMSGVSRELYPDPEEAVRHLTAAVALRAGSVTARTSLSQALQSLGKFEEAAAVAREAIRLQPDAAAAHNTLGNALKAQGKRDEAVAEYRAAIRLKPDVAVGHYNLGIALNDQGKRDEAVAEYREAIRLKPDYAVAHFNLGFALYNQGKRDEAVAEYREAIRLKPDDAAVHYFLGNALKDQGKRDEAVIAYREAARLDAEKAQVGAAVAALGTTLRELGRPDESVAIYRQVLERSPHDAAAHNSLGIALKAQGKRDEAVAEYREAIRLKPDYALAHNNLGAALYDQGKRDEAVAEYRDAIRLKPDEGVGHYYLGLALNDQGKRDEAVAEYREAARLDAEKGQVGPGLAALGTTLRELGRPDESVAIYRQVLEKSPHDAAAHDGLGHALNDQGKRDEAVAEFRAAIRLKPDYAEAHVHLGDALKVQGKHDEAIAAYREATRLKLDDPLAPYFLGVYLQGLGRLDEAIASYRAAARLDAAKGQGGSAILALGNALRAQGKDDEAIAVFREAIRIKPSEVAAHNNLGIALNAQGKIDEALEAYTAAIRINPGTPQSWRDRGLLLANLGRWREARDDLDRALELDPAGHLDWFRAATLDLWLGDRDGYRRRCLGMLDRFEATADPLVAERVAKACLLDPRPYEGWGRAGRLAERSASGKVPSGHLPWSNATRALAAVRAGRPAEAVERARPTPGASLYAEVLSELVLALASHHAGRPVEAGLWLDLARRSIAARTPALDGVLPAFEWHDLLHLHLLLREAEPLIGGVAPAAAADPLPPDGVRLRAELGRGFARLAAALRAQGKRDEAAAAYRDAIRLEPEDASAHCELAGTLVSVGDYAEAIAMYRKGEELGSKRPGWTYPVAQGIAEAQRRAALAGRLAAILGGDDVPRDAAERLALAQFCHDTRRHAVAARLWAEALEADPKLGDDPVAAHRYHAACAAASAGCGTGDDQPPPDEAGRARLRRQALDWLRAELARRGEQLETGTAAARDEVRRKLTIWQSDAGLSGVRDPGLLSGLPEAERTAWRDLWADVEGLRKRAEGHAP